MRLRTALLSFVALVATLLGNPAPASAAFAGALTGTMTISCYGCGYVTDGNSWSFACSGLCGGPSICVSCPGFARDFAVDSPPNNENCRVSGLMSGILVIDGREAQFYITLLGDTWLMTSELGDGVGVFAVTHPVATSPCARPVTATAVGTIAGA